MAFKMLNFLWQRLPDPNSDPQGSSPRRQWAMDQTASTRWRPQEPWDDCLGSDYELVYYFN